MRVILASASPRRKELLEQIGVKFEIQPAKGEEIKTKELPQDVVMELAQQKAREIAKDNGILVENLADMSECSVKANQTAEESIEKITVVIGADTIVAYGDEILGKPKDEEDAFRMLSMLQGETHAVYTGVSLMIAKDGNVTERTFYEKTEVRVHKMNEQEIRNYIASKEPMDKAGSYGIQGKFAAFIDGIDGDYNNVVGLPVAKIYHELLHESIDILGVS